MSLDYPVYMYCTAPFIHSLSPVIKIVSHHGSKSTDPAPYVDTQSTDKITPTTTITFHQDHHRHHQHHLPVHQDKTDKIQAQEDGLVVYSILQRMGRVQVELALGIQEHQRMEEGIISGKGGTVHYLLRRTLIRDCRYFSVAVYFRALSCCGYRWVSINRLRLTFLFADSGFSGFSLCINSRVHIVKLTLSYI
jgi:hypothetical protein